MIDLKKHNRTATVVLNRPNHLNALPIYGWEQLGKIVHDIGQDPTVLAVVFRGQGGKAFSTGIDLQELSERSSSEASRALIVVEETLLRVEHLPMPTIACVNGWVLGAGCELALACDLRVAAIGTRIGLPMARLGLMASSRLLKRLVDYVGPGIAKQLLFTGNTLSAAEAKRCGLVNYATRSVDAVLEELVAQINESSFGALKAAKRAVALGYAAHNGSWALDKGPSYFIDPVHFQRAVQSFASGRRAASRSQGEARRVVAKQQKTVGMRKA